MAHLVLRAAQTADADLIARMLAELGYSARSENVVGRLAAVQQEGGTVLIAEDAQQRALGLISLARHAVLHAPGPVAQITALVITAAARRKGVGRALVAAGRDWAEERGCVASRSPAPSIVTTPTRSTPRAACPIQVGGTRSARSAPGPPDQADGRCDVSAGS